MSEKITQCWFYAISLIYWYYDEQNKTNKSIIVVPLSDLPSI